MKKVLAIIVLLGLCFSLTSCGAMNREVKMTYPVDSVTSDSLTTYTFTVNKTGEYVVSQICDADVSCTAYVKDGENLKQIAHESERGIFTFSFRAEKGSEIVLIFTNYGDTQAEGTIKITELTKDTVCDVAYGHVVDLNSEKTEPTNAKGQLYSFTAPEDGIYVVSASSGGNSVVEVVGDEYGATPGTNSVLTSYPREEYLIDCDNPIGAIEMSAGETVLFSVTNAESIEMVKHTAVPDEVSAVEFMEMLFDKYWIFIHDIRKDYIDPLWYSSRAVVTDFDNVNWNGYTAERIAYKNCYCTNGKPISTYMTEKEYNSFSDIEGGCGEVYSLSTANDVGRIVYGDGNFKFVSDPQNGYIVSSKGYICQPGGRGGVVGYDCKLIAGDATTFENYANVKIEYQEYDWDDRKNGLSPRKDLSKVEYVVIGTPDGTRLWDWKGWKSYNHDDNFAMPETSDNILAKLPDVIPTEYANEYYVTVKASSGLRQRTGPGTDYDTIITIPNKTPLRCYGEQDGWYYVKFAGRYGWVSADYIVNG